MIIPYPNLVGLIRSLQTLDRDTLNSSAHYWAGQADRLRKELAFAERQAEEQYVDDLCAILTI